MPAPFPKDIRPISIPSVSKALRLKIYFKKQDLVSQLKNLISSRFYSSFRSRATGMFSCSRYLATVRRAML